MEKRTVIGAITILSILLTYWACGISDPKYVNYIEADPGTTTLPASECATAALGLFTANVHSVLITSCATAACHAATAISGSPLSLSSAAENKTIISKYTGTDPEILFNKLSASPTANPPGHGGADQSGQLPLSQIKEWTDKEAECAAEG